MFIVALGANFLFLTVFTSACPDVCKCVVDVVDCSNKDLLSFPSHINRTTVELRLNNNQISSLNNNYGDQGQWLGALKILDLRYNNLSTIPDLAFNRFFSLEVLKLDYNKIAFKDPKHTVDPFGGLEGILKHLSASHNMMTGEVTEFAFGYHELDHLDLSHNNFHSIEPYALPHSLKYLDISYNNITTLTMEAFESNMELEYLDLRGLSTTSLQTATFRTLSNLMHLKLGGRDLKELEESLFIGLADLTTLEIVDSNINSLPSFLLENCTSLIVLNLSNNRLNSIHHQFFSFSSGLRDINLSGNRFEDGKILSKPLAVTNIQSLNLNSNLLSSSISSLISSQKSLQDLHLAHNRLTSLHKSFNSATLRSLNLAFNFISDIGPEVFVNCTALESVNFTGNSLKSIPSFSMPKKLKLFVDDMRWDCNCNFFELLKTEKFNANLNLQVNCSERKSSQSCMVCFTPPQLQGKIASSLTAEDFAFCTAAPVPVIAGYTTMIISISIAVIFLIAGAIIFAWFKRDYLKNLTRKARSDLALPKIEVSAYAGMYESQENIADIDFSVVEDENKPESPYSFATEAVGPATGTLQSSINFSESNGNIATNHYFLKADTPSLPEASSESSTAHTNSHIKPHSQASVLKNKVPLNQPSNSTSTSNSKQTEDYPSSEITIKSPRQQATYVKLK